MPAKRVHAVNEDNEIICPQDARIMRIETTLLDISTDIKSQLKEFRDFCFGNGKPGADEMMRGITSFIEDHKANEKEVKEERQTAEKERKTLKRMLLGALATAVFSLITTVIAGLILWVIKGHPGVV